MYLRYFRHKLPGSSQNVLTPAIKCYSLIPVPYATVLRFMSNSSNIQTYNEFITDRLRHPPPLPALAAGPPAPPAGFADLPSPPPTPPRSFSERGFSWKVFPIKMCYAETPKILFIPPRSFLTLMQLKVSVIVE